MARTFFAPRTALDVAIGPRGDPSYDTDAAAYFARFSVDPGATFKDAANVFVLALKSAAVWSKLDHIGVFATPLTADKLLDLRDAASSFSVGGTTTFTANRGIAGNGTDGYVGFPEALGAAGNQFAQDSASFGVYCNAQGALGTGTQVPHLGGTGAARTNYLANDTGQEIGRINQTANSTNIRVSSTRQGHRAGSRTGSAVTRFYYNGAFTKAYTPTSAAPDAFIATVGRNGTAYIDDRFAAAWSGGALSDSEQSAMNAALHTFMTAIGAQHA